MDKTTNKNKKPVRKGSRTSIFKYKKNRTDQQYGTSQLERDFATEFLEKYNIPFVYQYEAKQIKRFFDFAIVADRESFFFTEEKDGLKSIKQEGQYVPIDFIIEIDGDYW